MGQELAVWPRQATTLSLEQRSSISRVVLSSTTSATEAARAAKQLVGSYAHMKPGDPDVFVASIAAVLSGYPLGLVQECADPRFGIARTAKFLSIAELVEWLDRRLEFHQALAGHKPRPPALPAPVFSDDHKRTMLGKLRDLMAGLMARNHDPIDALKRAHRASQEPAP